MHFIDLILHLDRHLTELVADYGPWVYGKLFLIIFCETGLVVTPFLPGDSLLFVAGIGKMAYPRFLAYNVGGGLFWGGGFVLGGYLFGDLPLVKENLGLVIVAIIIVSIMPGVIEYWRQRRAAG